MEAGIPWKSIALIVVAVFVVYLQFGFSVSLLVPVILGYAVFSWKSIVLNAEIDKARSSSVYLTLLISTYTKLTRNLEGAIKIASNALDNMLTATLRNVVWCVETKKCNNISNALEKYKERIKQIDPYFSHVLEMIRESLNEAEAVLKKSMDDAVSFHISSAEKMVMDFIEKALNPIKMGFSLLVLLPVILVVVIPIAGFLIESEKAVFELAVLMDIIIPASIILYVVSIMNKRPIFSLGGFSQSIVVDKKALVIAVVLFAFVFFISNGIFPYLRFLLLISLLGFLVAFVLYYSNAQLSSELSLFGDVEKDLTVLLKEIGVGLRRGVPLESILKRVSKKQSSMQTFSDKTKELLNDLYSWILVKGKSVAEFVAQSNIGSAMIRDVLLIVSLASKKGSVEAGNVVDKLALYLNSLNKLDAMFKELLQDITSNLYLMAVFAIPLISAISLSFAVVMVNYLSTITVGENIVFEIKEINITPAQLVSIITVYAVEMMAISSFLYCVLRLPNSKPLMTTTIARMLMIGIAVYVVGFLISNAILVHLMGGVV